MMRVLGRFVSFYDERVNPYLRPLASMATAKSDTSHFAVGQGHGAQFSIHGWDSSRVNEQIREMNEIGYDTVWAHGITKNSNRVEKLDCSIRQTNPRVLIAVHAPTMVGPTASSQAVR
eukprot:COSAG02_NODE_3555_length_6569_cov_36.053941_8_plen_118_part_00